MTNPRTRVAAVAGSMALSMSLALAPAAMAQDDPTTPVNEILTAFSEGRFADATEPFSAEREETALGGFGQADELVAMGLGVDMELVFEALDIDTSGLDVTVVEQGDESAIVNVSGEIVVGFDEEGLVTMVTTMMSTDEVPLTEEMVAAMLPAIMPEVESMIGGAVDVDQDVVVVLEEGVWQVDDDLSALGDALAASMGAPSDGDTDDMDSDDDEDE